MLYVKINHGDYVSYRTYEGQSKESVEGMLAEQDLTFRFITKQEFDLEVAKIMSGENNGN